MPQRSSALLTVACVRDSREYTVQGISKRLFLGLVNFVPAVAFHLCLNLPEAFSQPGNGLLEVPCKAFLLRPARELGLSSTRFPLFNYIRFALSKAIRLTSNQGRRRSQPLGRLVQPGSELVGTQLHFRGRGTK